MNFKSGSEPTSYMEKSGLPDVTDSTRYMCELIATLNFKLKTGCAAGPGRRMICELYSSVPNIPVQKIITRLKFGYKLLFSGTGTLYTNIC